MTTNDPNNEPLPAESRAAIDATKDWLQTDPPGIDRVDALAIPSGKIQSHTQPATAAPVVAINPRRRAVTALAQTAAAAAIFIFGFGLGKWTTPPEKTEAQSPAPTAPLPAELVSSTEIKNSSETENTEPAIPTSPPEIRYTDEQGRLIVETTLAGSGARATWIVDAGFQMNPSTAQD